MHNNHLKIQYFFEKQKNLELFLKFNLHDFEKPVQCASLAKRSKQEFFSTERSGSSVG